jgi:hypothetical protein
VGLANQNLRSAFAVNVPSHYFQAPAHPLRCVREHIFSNAAKRNFDQTFSLANQNLRSAFAVNVPSPYFQASAHLPIQLRPSAHLQQRRKKKIPSNSQPFPSKFTQRPLRLIFSPALLSSVSAPTHSVASVSSSSATLQKETTIKSSALPTKI